ncbi:MAG: hypothetical protein DMG07_05185 [Acidobacteria bacterium]|nr:MAG: hypothetical protein DMG07_05185 [Acidobacteriota bacterium]
MNTGTIGFTTLDWTILVVYVAGSAALGSLFVRGQKSSEDFFLAGRSLWWFPMALSVIATDFSAISFLGVPGYVVARDLVLDVQPLVFLWVLPLAQLLFLRMFHGLELISAYEYLERRFNLPLRTACSLLFICVRTGWMATALYATSVALTQVAGWQTSSCILVIGGITTVYSALGGMKAVIWTDVAQFFVFMAGIALVFARSLGSVPGGIVEVWHAAARHGHTRIFDWNLDPTRVSSFGVLIGGTFLVLISYGVDQIIIQRYLSARSSAEIRRSMVLQMSVTPVIMWMLALTGLALVGFYSRFPDRIPRGLEADKWFPYFIVHELPPGVSGTVIAGVFAATMSSISSGVNSITAACVIDFYRRFFGRGARSDAQDARELRISRALTLFWGLVATLLGLVVGRIGVITLIAKTLSGFFGGVLLGVFLLGILSRRSNGPGVFLGGLLGFATIAAVGLGTRVNLFWYAPIGVASTVAAGALLSLAFPPPATDKLERYTLPRRAHARSTGA